MTKKRIMASLLAHSAQTIQDEYSTRVSGLLYKFNHATHEREFQSTWEFAMISAQRGDKTATKVSLSYLQRLPRRFNRSLLRLVGLAFDAPGYNWIGLDKIEPISKKDLLQRTILAAHFNHDEEFAKLFIQCINSWSDAIHDHKHQIPKLLTCVWSMDRELIGPPDQKIAEAVAEATRQIGVRPRNSVVRAAERPTQNQKSIDVGDTQEQIVNAIAKDDYGDAFGALARLKNGMIRCKVDFNPSTEFLSLIPKLITMDFDHNKNLIARELAQLLPQLSGAKTDDLVSAQIIEWTPAIQFLAGASVQTEQPNLEGGNNLLGALRQMHGRVRLEIAALPEDLKDGWKRMYGLQSRALVEGNRNALRFLMPWAFKQHVAVSNLAFAFIGMEKGHDVLELARVVASDHNMLVKALNYARDLSTLRFGSTILPTVAELRIEEFSRAKAETNSRGISLDPVTGQKRNTLTLSVDTVPIRVSQVPAEFWNYRPVDRKAVGSVSPGWKF